MAKKKQTPSRAHCRDGRSFVSTIRSESLRMVSLQLLVHCLPIEINVVDGILEGDLDLLPHHGGSGLGGSGHTAGGGSDRRSGRIWLFLHQYPE